MTAAFIGVLIISAAAWGWGQAGVIRLPARTWSFSINNVHGSINPGDRVDMFHYDEKSSTPEIPVNFGYALVDEISISKGSTATIVVSAFSNEEVRLKANDAIKIIAGDEEAPSFDASIRGSTPTPIFPIEYLQSGVAGGVMLLGAILLYLFVGSRKRTVEFLIATDGEMKKVNWTSYREVKGSTIVVIVATFLIAGFLFGVDYVFSQIFHAMGVLER
jgi:preprotein translocase SecE subunit